MDIDIDKKSDKWQVTVKELIDLLFLFCKEIKEGKFSVLPSKASFVLWLCEREKQVSNSAVLDAVDKHFPKIIKKCSTLLSDTLLEGAALSKYNTTITTFCLKNWFDFKDKQEAEDGDGGHIKFVLSGELKDYAE